MTWSTSDVAVCCSNDFGKLARALLLRLEQPRVLDGDHRLIGEGLDQLDLLLGERPYGSALQDEHTNRNPLSKKRYAKDCAKIAELAMFTEGVFRISKNIWNLNGLALQQNSTDYTAASRRKCQMFRGTHRTRACDGSLLLRRSLHPSRSVGGLHPCRPRTNVPPTRPAC